MGLQLTERTPEQTNHHPTATRARTTLINYSSPLRPLHRSAVLLRQKVAIISTVSARAAAPRRSRRPKSRAASRQGHQFHTVVKHVTNRPSTNLQVRHESPIATAVGRVLESASDISFQEK